MIPVYYHSHIYGAGLPNPWYFQDNPFDENFVNHNEYKIQSTWDDNTVEYHIDNLGFRKAGNINDDLWFFGCSHTFGEALNQDYFADIVGRNLNKSYYNFGTPSASLSLIARLLYKLRNKIKDKTIVVQIPSLTRFEIISSDGVFKSANPHANYYEENLPKFNVNEFLDYKVLQCVMLIDILTKNCNRNFFSFETHPYLNILNVKNISHDNVLDLAYDKNHYGYKTHQNIADIIMKNLR